MKKRFRLRVFLSPDMNVWRILPDISAPMPFQMALDEVLFRGCENDSLKSQPLPMLRFFYSSEPWITVGYSHEQLLRGETMRACKRMTGGGRVLHGKDLMFALIARKTDDTTFKSVRESYWKIHEAVKQGLESEGCKVQFYRCDEKLETGKDCFVYPIATDLSMNGKKIAGGSQKRSRGFFLHEESIQPILGLTRDRVRAAILRGFEKVFNAVWQPGDLDPSWMNEARILSAEKYEPDRAVSRCG